MELFQKPFRICTGLSKILPMYDGHIEVDKGIWLCRTLLDDFLVDFGQHCTILDQLRPIWTILSIWTILFEPIYLDLSIWTCLFSPVYRDLSLWTRLFGPIYLDP